MVPTQISCFFFPRGFLWQVFSGLRSNCTSIVSDCSAPVLLYYYLLLLAFFTCTIFLYLGLVNNSNCDIMCSFMGIYVQSCGRPSLTGLICLCTGIYVQSCGRPSLTGLICLCTGIYVQSCGRPSLTGLICLCTGIYVQSCGRPSLTGLICLCTGIYVQSCGHPSLTGLICLCTGMYVQSCGHPSLTGVICLYMMIFVQSSGYRSLNGTMVAYRDWSKVVDSPDYVLVACLFLCSVKRICISERFWSRVVTVRCKVFFLFFCVTFGHHLRNISTRQIYVL